MNKNNISDTWMVIGMLVCLLTGPMIITLIATYQQWNRHLAGIAMILSMTIPTMTLLLTIIKSRKN